MVTTNESELEGLVSAEEAEGPHPIDAPSELLVDSLLLALIRAQPDHNKSSPKRRTDLARLRDVTKAIFGRDPVIQELPNNDEKKAVRYMVELLHNDAIKARESPGKHKRLSISKAASAAQKLYLPDSVRPDNTHKRLQHLYTGSYLNKNPDRVGEGGKVDPYTYKKGLFYEYTLEDYVEESMVRQQLIRIEAILKPWGTPMKLD